VIDGVGVTDGVGHEIWIWHVLSCDGK
jgi:hypothetical protein